MSIHLLEARQAFRLGENGCPVKGTQQVVVERDVEQVTCRACKHWYWHVEGLQLSPQGQAYVNSLNQHAS